MNDETLFPQQISLTQDFSIEVLVFGISPEIVSKEKLKISLFLSALNSNFAGSSSGCSNEDGTTLERRDAKDGGRVEPSGTRWDLFWSCAEPERELIDIRKILTKTGY